MVRRRLFKCVSKITLARIFDSRNVSVFALVGTQFTHTPDEKPLCIQIFIRNSVYYSSSFDRHPEHFKVINLTSFYLFADIINLKKNMHSETFISGKSMTYEKENALEATEKRGRL